MKRAVWVAALAVLVTYGAARADVGVSYSASSRVAGAYIFRGSEVDDISLLSSLGASHWFNSRLGVRAGVYTFVPLGNMGTNLGVAETDLEAGLTWKPWNLISLNAGWRTYQLNSAYFVSPDFSEVSGGVTFNVPWSPTITANYRYDGGASTYVEATAGNRFKLGNNRWSLSLFGSAAFLYDSTQWAAPVRIRGGFSNAVLRTGLTYDLGEGWSLGPAIDWHYRARKVAIRGLNPDHFQGVGSFGFQYNGTF